MQRHGRAPVGFDSLGKWTQMEKLSPGCWRSGCLQAASPCWGQGEVSSFSSCLCPRHTRPRAQPSLLSVPARIAAGFCFNTLSPDAGQHWGGIAGTGPAPSSPQPCLTHTGQRDAQRWMPGHPVTASYRALGVWPPQQESRHLAGAAARQGGSAGRRHFVGVNFPFLTSGLWHIFPGRTCLPGDDSDVSASPAGDRQSPALAKTPSACFQPTFYFEEEEEEDGQEPQCWSGCQWGSVPAGPLHARGRQERAATPGSKPGHAGMACTPVAPQLPVLSVPALG